MKDQMREFVRAIDGPIRVAIVVVSLVALMGWQYSRAQLGGRAPSRRDGGLGASGLAIAVLGLAVARVTLLK